MLAVDDDLDALMMVREILEVAGASDHRGLGRRALGARDAVPDVLVADLGMPRMGGFELIARCGGIRTRIRGAAGRGVDGLRPAEDRVSAAQRVSDAPREADRSRS